MKIESQSYIINSSKELIEVKFKVPSLDGINVRDLHSDLSTAIAYRGQQIDAALPRDENGNIISGMNR
jgi:hypothetical protein